MFYNEDKNSIKIYLKDKIIFHFKKGKVNIELFCSKLSITSSRGSFFFKEKLYESIKLKNYEILDKNERLIKINFENKIEIFFEKIKENYLNQNDSIVKIYFNVIDKKYNGINILLNAYKDEKIFGVGEQFSFLNLKGKKVPIFCQEQGIGRGKNLFTFLVNLLYKAGGNYFTTYYAEPSFISNKSYFLIANSYDYSIFNFKKNLTIMKFYTIPDWIIIGASNSLISCLKLKTSLVGKQEKIPDWVFNGAILGIQGGKEIVLKKLEKAKKHNIKISAVWCQDWEGKRITSFGKQLFWDWIYDNNLYPNLPEFIKLLNKEGIKFLGYINPFLCTDGKLYQIAKQKNLLLKNEKGEPYHVKITTFPAAILDLTNPETIEWIKSIIKENMLDIGLSGWMADFGEHTPIDCMLKDKYFINNFRKYLFNDFYKNLIDTNFKINDSNISNDKDTYEQNIAYENNYLRDFHNIYPVIWAKINIDAIKESKKENEIFIFSRSGFLGTSKISMCLWGGDQLVDWSKDDGLPSVIISYLSSSFSSIAANHSDIGGYTTVAWKKRDKELFLRWTELGAFSIIMRTHEGNRPDVNVQFDYDEETLKHFSKFSHIYSRLKEYYIHVYNEYYKENLPFYRHLSIYYPEDKNIYKYDYCYLIGKDLLIYPIIKKGRRKIKVYIPENNFIHLFTGVEYKKGFHVINSPIGIPAVFYRKDSTFSNLFSEIKNLF
ncbi:MAG: alpha-glucosidase [Spirochaetes bacterium]|nr:alpha-glucosidase [Spirochaetota bacterium]